MPAPSWPTTESTLFLPGLRTFLVAGMLLATVGIGASVAIWPRFLIDWRRAGSVSQLWREQSPWPVVWPILGFAAIWGVGVLVALALISNRPFRHAAPGVLPDVPSGPVNAPGGTAHGRITHVLLPAENGWCLGPCPDLYRRTPLYMRVFMLFVAALMIAMMVVSGMPGREIIFFGAACVVIGSLTAGLIGYFFVVSRNWLLTLVVDPAQGLCRINSKPPRVIPWANLTAVQLCACRRKVGDKYNLSIYDVVELNLVWRTMQETAPASNSWYERLTLVENKAVPEPRLAQLAEEFAERLGVPLLYHATEEHWRLERKAAKARPPHFLLDIWLRRLFDWLARRGARKFTP
jgi:hypothetical protein